MPNTLKLELGKVYIDSNKDYVRMTRQYSERDSEYHEGFRYRGNNGVSYRPDGGTFVFANGTRYDRPKTAPIVSELRTAGVFETLQLKKFYRNGLDEVVLIIDLVPVTSRFYKKGYRFVDDRNTYYKPNGVTVSKGLFAKLNIISDVLSEHVTQAEMDTIHNNVERHIASLDRYDEVCRRIDSIKDSVTTFTKKFGIQLGVGFTAGLAAGVAMAPAS